MNTVKKPTLAVVIVAIVIVWWMVLPILLHLSGHHYTSWLPW
jgi:hypothetical protein